MVPSADVITDGPVPAIFPGPLLPNLLERTLSKDGLARLIELATDGLPGDRDVATAAFIRHLGAIDVDTVRSLGASRFDLKYSSGTLPHPALMRSLELFGTEAGARLSPLTIYKLENGAEADRLDRVG